MKQYIELNGISSLSFGLGLLNADLSLLPMRRKERETLYGSIRALEGEEYLYPGATISVTLAAQGEDKAAVMAAFHRAAGWLSTARFMRLWSYPDYYYEGSFEGANSLNMIAKGIGSMELDFTLNPGCAQRAVGLRSGWVPTTDLPLPEQISDTIKTIEGKFTKAGSLASSGQDLSSVYPPAIYLCISGTWTHLVIGGTLEINEPAQSATTLYIDADRQQVYTIADGLRRNVKHSGEFPSLAKDGTLDIAGESMNITAKMLVIERR